MIYHVTTTTQWEEAKAVGFFEEPSLHTEGFIHNSTEAQVEGVIKRYYSGKKNLILLHIEEMLLTSPLKYEMAASINEMFPHIFGVINIDAVVKTTAI